MEPSTTGVILGIGLGAGFGVGALCVGLFVLVWCCVRRKKKGPDPVSVFFGTNVVSSRDVELNLPQEAKQMASSSVELSAVRHQELSQPGGGTVYVGNL